MRAILSTGPILLLAACTHTRDKSALPGIAELCNRYAWLAYDVGRVFLYLAIAFAVAETIAALWIKARTPPSGETKTLTPINAILDALKGVLEALKDLPAWIAMFLAGVALLWMAGQRIEKPCPSPPPPATAPKTPA